MSANQVSEEDKTTDLLKLLYLGDNITFCKSKTCFQETLC